MPSADSRPSPRPWLLTSRVFAVLTVAVVVVLFVTAGRLVQARQLEDVHGAAAIALHVASGGLMVALAGLAYERRRGWWAAALACALFVFTFVQAVFGEREMLALHIPGALAVSAATFWLTAWLFLADGNRSVVSSGSVRTIPSHMEPDNAATPKDASEATEEQRELQEQLDHQDDDPDAPARGQTYRQVPGEN